MRQLACLKLVILALLAALVVLIGGILWPAPPARAQTEDKGPFVTATVQQANAGDYLLIYWNFAPTAYVIGLYDSNAPNGQYVTETYIAGASGSAYLEIPSATPSGGYQLRLFSDKDVTMLAASGGITIYGGAPTGTIHHEWSSLRLGSMQTFEWQLFGALHSNDQIRIYQDGVPDYPYYATCYTNAHASGQLNCYLDPAQGYPVPGNFYGCLLSGFTGQIVVCDYSFAIPY